MEILLLTQKMHFNDVSQWSDTDNDGYGDNPNGTNPDAYPDDPERWELIDAALGSEAESRLSNQTITIGVGLMRFDIFPIQIWFKEV